MRKCLVAVALGTGLLLLIPLVAMQITDEVSWGVIDFLAAGTLLFSAGAAAVVAVRRFKRPVQRALAVAAIALTLALIWAQLAVGLFD